MIWTLVLLWIVLAEADRWRCVCCSSIQDLAGRRDDDGDGLWETEREFSGWTFASCNRSWSQFSVTVNLRMETLNFRERHEDCLKKLPAKLTGQKPEFSSKTDYAVSYLWDPSWRTGEGIGSCRSWKTQTVTWISLTDTQPKLIMSIMSKIMQNCVLL